MSDQTARFKSYGELTDILEGSGITARHSGASTPYNLLLTMTAEMRELRKVQDEHMRQTAAVVAALKDQNDLLREQLEQSRSQTDALSMMLRSMDRPMSVGPSQSLPGTPAGKRGSPSHDKAYYCEGEKVSTGPGVIAVVLIQIINIVTDQLVAAHYPAMTNDNPLSFKELRSVVTAVAGVDPAIILPKLSSSVTQDALKYVCSTDPSIPTRCETSHISDLTRECSQVTSTVEKVRQRLLQCEGVLGPYQHVCLAAVDYPYVSGTDLALSPGIDIPRVFRTIRFRNSNVRRMKPAVRNDFIGSMMAGMPYSSSYAEATKAK